MNINVFTCENGAALTVIREIKSLSTTKGQMMLRIDGKNETLAIILPEEKTDEFIKWLGVKKTGMT